MDDLDRMRCRQGRGNLPADANGIGNRQAATAAAQPLGQRVAVQVLHDDEGAAVGEAAELIDLDDAGVIDPAGGPRFVEEAVLDLFVRRELFAQKLDRALAAELLVHSFVDRAHAALADFAHHAITTDALSFHL